MPLLAVDVGAGTQDLLLYKEGISLEGSAKMVLPSQTVVVAARIDRARSRHRDIFLKGPTMGGGASTAAVMRHLDAGLKVYAAPSAAATISDNLDRVASMGVIIQEEERVGAESIITGDLDLAAIREVFGLFELEVPKEVAVAVQDHGYSPQRSNRQARFEHMAEAIRAGGRIENFAFREPPMAMTRMLAVKDYLVKEGSRPLLMDSSPAAIFGATLDPNFSDPALVINFGNGHTVAAIIAEERVAALFEHHTSLLDQPKLRLFLSGLCSGTLKNTDIFDDGGHGAFVECVPDSVRSTLVTGPRREAFLLSGALQGAVAAAPGGDMMTTGCLGLLKAWLGEGGARR